MTFGCRLNTYESEAIKKMSTEAGLRNTVIINTCGVTAEAERQAQQAIRKLKRERPSLHIIATGCAVQMNPQRYADMPEIDRVLGNQEKMQPSSYTHPQEERVVVNDIMAVGETAAHLIQGYDGRVRAFIQVQNGCDHRCTFCSIPFGRGNSRSVPVGEIVRQVAQVVENGAREVVLTGVDVTAYGADLPGKPGFGQMIRRLLALVPQLPRLRLSSLDPAEIDEDLWKLIGNEPRLMPHYHISAQSGDDLILKRMKRRHLRADIIAFCQKVRERRPDAVFGADIIAGFPTESEGMFQNTSALIEECGLVYLHVFPYSPRPGTPAARMPQVHGSLIKERARLLRLKGQRVLDDYLVQQVGTEQEILLEHGNKGRTQFFAPVQVQGEGDQILSQESPDFIVPGTLGKARIIDVSRQHLVIHSSSFQPLLGDPS
jgi:threonylcarbamoyladenosine tRNA methylthiotransferase MtaB